METTYRQIRARARLLLSEYPQPQFYVDHSRSHEISRALFDRDPRVRAVQIFTAETIENDFGHGMEHAVKVTLDAGALMVVEGEQAGFTQDTIDRLLVLVQCAGLLHDIRRKKDHHAVRGADFAREILPRFSLALADIEAICLAIRNHEAFQETVDTPSPEERFLSDCLYDADKFRWGPDNFYHTLWDMVSFYKIPLKTFMAHYPSGMKRLMDIRRSFRSRSGKKYGPQFIDIGLAVGKKLYEYIGDEFSHLL
jgi:hypothetical protein